MIVVAKVIEIGENRVADKGGTHTKFIAILVDEQNDVKVRVSRPIPFDDLRAGQRLELRIEGILGASSGSVKYG